MPVLIPVVTCEVLRGQIQPQLRNDGVCLSGNHTPKLLL